MKYIVNLILIISLFTSCVKEDTTNNVVSPVGTTWKLYSGRIFITNLDNNRKAYYDHFGQNVVSGNLDPFSPSTLPIDNINQSRTTWLFTDSKFILDDTLSYSYSVSHSINPGGNFRVYGLENGSARPIEVYKSTQTELSVKLYSSNGNDGKDNYSFYSILTFTKLGSTVTPDGWPVPPGYNYGGVIGINLTPSPTLVGTTWIVRKYTKDFSTTFPNDTLNFISNTDYTINNLPVRNYNLSSIIGSNMKSLSLYSFTTLGGDWTGEVQSTFINDRVINMAKFYNLFSSGEATVWMERTQ